MQAKKTRVINFRLSEEDLEHIQHAASHGGESVCEYARRAVFLRSGLGAKIAQPTPHTLAQGVRLNAAAGKPFGAFTAANYDAQYWEAVDKMNDSGNA